MWQTLKYLPKILKNIFLYNFYKRFRKCDYPVSILPKLNYVSLIDIQSLLDNQTVYIIRRSDKSEEDTFNELGQLRDDVLLPKDIPFLSLNILGGSFRPEHSKFRLLKNGRLRWSGGTFISILDYLNEYTKLDEYSLIYINANGVDRQSVPYAQPSNPELKKEVEKFEGFVVKPTIIDGSFEFQGYTRLLHDPVCLNYWHLELNVLDFKGVAIKPRNSKYIENFCKTVISHIISANSFSTLPEIKEIPKSVYYKSILSF